MGRGKLARMIRLAKVLRMKIARQGVRDAAKVNSKHARAAWLYEPALVIIE